MVVANPDSSFVKLLVAKSNNSFGNYTPNAYDNLLDIVFPPLVSTSRNGYGNLLQNLSSFCAFGNYCISQNL